MNEIHNVLAVAGGEKDLRISLDKESLILLGVVLFLSMLLAVVFGGLLVKKLG